MLDVSPELNVPQAAFLQLAKKFRAFIGGFGSGKTWVGCGGICQHFYEHPRIDAGYFAPTYGMIRDIFYPTMEEVAADWGFTTRVREAKKEVSIYRGSKFYGRIICRSMDNPGTIVGFKIGHGLVDEIDTLPQAKALLAWRKIIARLRLKAPGLRNGVDVTTTPEGFGFVYGQFVKLVRDNPALAELYGLVQASTYDNEENLPDDYISSLVASYPPNLIQAYIEGKFTNLVSGSVYHVYDRVLNASFETVKDSETLHIGMDFNVGQMAAVVHVLRDGLPHAVEEAVKLYDTPAMIETLKARYWRYIDGNYRRTREIRIYPDASGSGRKSNNASKTDLQLLVDAGFTVIARKANPPVKDRVNAMNAMFLNAAGERRYRVNPLGCPTYADNLEQQVWAASGEPDKANGNDHTNDAAGYVISKLYPVIRPAPLIKLGYAH